MKIVGISTLRELRYTFFLAFICLVTSCSQGRPFTFFKETRYTLTEHKATEVETFLENNSPYNQDIVFYIDFRLPSSAERFFVIDARQDTIVNRGLVTHGNCNGSTAERNDKYSNTSGSYCTSLGKYKVGHSYQGNFGLAYKLHGLDQTNSRAFERFIVLHSHECVPDRAVNYEICLSQGCPTVSPTFLKTIARYIDESEKPILLWLDDDLH